MIKVSWLRQSRYQGASALMQYADSSPDRSLFERRVTERNTERLSINSELDCPLVHI